MILGIRTAVKLLKKGAYTQNVHQLNANNENGKFHAIADVEVRNLKSVGVTGRPSILTFLKNTAMSAIGHNKRVFVAFETSEGKVLFLLLHPQENIDEDKILEGANFDSGFASDRGVSVLTAENTVVRRGGQPGEHVYIFEPSQDHKLKHEGFELRVLVEGHEHSESNAQATVAWLDSIAV